MEKKTKVKISLIVIPFIVVLLIVGVVVLIISINKMQKEPTENSIEKINEVTENIVNTTNTTDNSKNSNKTNTTKSNKDSKNDTSNENDKSISEMVENNKKDRGLGIANDALRMALSCIATDYYSGELEGIDNLADALTAEALEEESPEYIYEVSWNKNKTIATVRMQLKRDNTGPVYRAKVTDILTVESLEEESEN